MKLLDDLEKSPYFSVVLDFALSTPMVKRRSPKRLLQQRTIIHQNIGEGFETVVIPAQYEENHSYGFQLTPSGACRIAVGVPRIKDVEQLENDLIVAEQSGLFVTDQEAFAHLF